MKKKLIIVLVVFTIIGAGLFYVLTKGNIGLKHNTVEVTKVEVGKYVEDTGRISSKNIRSYYGSGSLKVEEMTLTLGDSVKKGEVLIRFEDNIDLEIQKVQKAVEALEATYSDSLSIKDVEGISNAKIEIARIRREIEVAEKDKERTEILYNNGAESLVAVEKVVNHVVELESSLKIAQNNYNKIAKGISTNLRKKYEAEIDALLISQEILEKQRENYIIYALSDGIVTELNTFEGDRPSGSQRIIEVQDATEKVVLVDFMVEDAMGIRSDFEAEISDINLDIAIDELTVDRVYPKAFMTLSELGVRENRQTVEIGLSKANMHLPFGLEVKTKVLIEAPREVLLVPIGAVIEDQSKTYVKVLQGKTISQKEITTGIRVDKNIEVVNGLTEGELVIINYEEN